MGFSGERMRERRKALGMSAAKLGQAVCVQQPQIARIENGTRNPSSELLPAIARELKCSIDYFYPEMDGAETTVGADGFEDDDSLDCFEAM